MKAIIVILVFLFLIEGLLCIKNRRISSLVPQPQRVRNELVQISRYEPSFQYQQFLRFDFDIQNLTPQPVELQINGGKLITPAGASYSMFDAAEAVAAAGGKFGHIAVSRKTGEMIDTGSNDYILKQLLKR